jgi:voltage-gated potassium channel
MILFKNSELRHFYYAILLLFGILALGTFGYVWIEDYPVLDGFYMTLITVSTIGFGEVHTLSPLGRLFTSGLILISLGFAAYSISTITRYILTGLLRDYFKISKVKKEIDQLKNHVIVVGYGRNGAQSVEELRLHHIPVVIIEQRESKLREIQAIGNLLWLNEDPSNDQTLIDAGIYKAKALITVMPTEEEKLFIVLTARAMSANLNIITRAINPNTIKKLKTAGASHVIFPDKISGQHMAKMIAQPQMVEFMYHLLDDSNADSTFQELMLQDMFVDLSISLTAFRQLLPEGLNLVGAKLHSGKFDIDTRSNVLMNEVHSIFVLGSPLDVSKYKRIVEKQ